MTRARLRRGVRKRKAAREARDTWPCWWRPAFSTTWCWRPTGRRILVKGRTTKELVLAEETENTEVYRERLRTTVVALDLDDGEITDIAA